MKALRNFIQLSLFSFLFCSLTSCGNDFDATNGAKKQFVGYWTSSSSPQFVVLDRNGYSFCNSTYSFGSWLYNPENDALSIVTSKDVSFLWKIATSGKSSWTGITSNGNSQTFVPATTETFVKLGLWTGGWKDSDGKYLSKLCKKYIPEGATEIEDRVNSFYFTLNEAKNEYIRVKFYGDKTEITESSFEMKYQIESPTWLENPEPEIIYEKGTVKFEDIYDFNKIKMTFSESGEIFHFERSLYY